jgi:hypothetical protein
MMSWLPLDDYQRDAIDRMKNGCILCGGVGSGKSRTALAYYYKQMGGDLDSDEYVPMDDPPKDLYIITTAHKRDLLEWNNELTPFLMYPNDSDGRSKSNLYCNNIIVDSWNNIKKYRKVIGAFFIFDEQRVVGSGAWVRAFLKIARGNRWILLSATPGDTWSDYGPVFVANGFYRNITEFRQEHIVWKYGSKFPQIDHFVGQGKLNKYRRDILIDMDYKNPATRHEEEIVVSYNKTDYKDLIKKRWNPITDMPIDNASEFCYLQRRLVNSSESRQLALLEIFEQHPKIIVFYNFDYELEILKDLFYDRFDGVQVAEWNGHKHEPIPDGGSWVYLVQYTAGAEGWNCTETDTMVFYSQTYSYKTLEQSMGRIDRRNTPFRDLYYYHLRSKSGIDLAITRALVSKKNFNISAYARNHNFYKETSKYD